jgi:membrane protease YdiL (CAAX protease family)
MSTRRLLLWTLVDLLAVGAIALGLLATFVATTGPNPTYGFLRAAEAIGVPIQSLGLHDTLERAAWWRYTEDMDCVTAPERDDALIGWVARQPGVYRASAQQREALTDRSQKETIRVSFRYFGPADLPRLEIPWKQLGYVPGEPEPWRWFFQADRQQVYNVSDPQFRLLFLGCLQAGMMVVGLFHLARRRSPAPIPPGSEGYPLFMGIGAGIAIAAVYWFYHQAVSRYGGPSAALAVPWACLPSIGMDMHRPEVPDVFRGVYPSPVMIGGMGFMAFLTPFALTVFFWGRLYPFWASHGRPWTGELIGAGIASASLLTLSFMPLAFAIALFLGWIFRRTKDLGAPMLALVLLSAAAIGIAFGAVPSLPRPVNQLPGKWRSAPQNFQIFGINFADKRPPLELEFYRGGAVRGELIDTSVEPIRVEREAWRYEWLDPDRLRIHWTTHTWNMAENTLISKVESRSYRALVDWKTLTLIDEQTGSATMFTRR